MEDWSPDNPFGAITPYWLRVDGRWRLADVLGPFLGEYVTCPFCENQKGLIFETDSSRLDQLADITCTCGRKFQLLEILGYDLQQRLAFLAGEETDPAWTAKVHAEDPDRATGPLPPAPDEPAEPKAVPAPGEATAPRMRTGHRSRTENRRIVVGRGEIVTEPARATAGSTTGKRRPAPQASERATRQAADEVTRSAPGTRVYRNDGIVNTGIVVVGDNQQVISNNGGQAVTSGGRVPRKVAARAERAVRDAQRQTQQMGGSGVRIHGENNSVVNNVVGGDQAHSTRATRKENP
ncbi:hypothetical protein [Streptomyces sp. NPDC060366]|uniref:hypothetical protein n=1 Tax=Streptomyces sp. NPDC060366 TaxID=3347105 RepID=UPI0036480C0C